MTNHAAYTGLYIVPYSTPPPPKFYGTLNPWTEDENFKHAVDPLRFFFLH